MMKHKIYLTLLSLILVTCITSSFTNSEKLDFTIEVVQTYDDKIDVIVTITSGEPEFTYSIWDKEPWEKGKEIESSGITYSTEFTFKNLRTKPYFVVVNDKRGFKRVKQIQLLPARQ